MATNDILKQIKSGEVSGVQFKERISDKYDIGCELVAFSNAHGGKLVIGVKDKTGDINALSYSEVQETTNLLSSIASDYVVPSILIKVETISVEDGNIVVATVKEGLNKPYHDNKGIVWMKNGADKRRVFDNAELAEMMTDCGSFAPDESAVRDAGISDLDPNTIKLFLSSKFERVLGNKGLSGDAFRDASLDEVCSAIANGHDAEHLLRNLRFIRPDGKLTVTAMLLFGKYTQRWLPVMTAKCICFVGNSVGGNLFRDKVSDEDMEGNILHQFNTIMNFFSRNLKRVQIGTEFNQQGKLEIPYSSLVEFIVNALVHRSLNQKAPIRVFIFDDRVEIHSPGTLPNGLTVDDIIHGTSMPRNTFLFDSAIHLLPYTGAGSGITRAMSERHDVIFTNDEKTSEFLITIPRDESNQVEEKSNQVEGESNQVGNEVEGKSNEVEKKSNQVSDLDTEHSYSNIKRKPLTNKQKDILNFCSVPRTASEIMDRLGISNQTRNRERHIMPLVTAGYLQLTNPDNPKASNQKYKRISMGK
jgi:ATP-dependent DNA helicase RecG